MARAFAPQDAHSQAGVSSRGPSSSASAAGPVAATLRNTALTRPANGASPRVRASATAVATAAWLGVSSSSSPAAPMRSTWRTGSGGALRKNGSSTASSVPSRRSTAAASRAPRGLAPPVAAARPAPPPAAGADPAPTPADRRRPRGWDPASPGNRPAARVRHTRLLDQRTAVLAATIPRGNPVALMSLRGAKRRSNPPANGRSVRASTRWRLLRRFAPRNDGERWSACPPRNRERIQIRSPPSCIVPGTASRSAPPSPAARTRDP